MQRYIASEAANDMTPIFISMCGIVSCTQKHSDPQSFRVAALFETMINNLPLYLPTDDVSHVQFVRELKTALFARAYSPEAPSRMLV